MKHRHVVSAGIVLLLAAVGGAACSVSAPSTGAPRSTRSAREQMIGSWELQTRTVRRASGEVVNDAVLGEAPIGRLFYDASGHMALQMMRQGRAQAIGEPASPEDAANARVRLGYDAYFGTFNVDTVAADGKGTAGAADAAVAAVAADGADGADGVRGTVTHHVQGSLFPDDLGKEFTRYFRVKGDTLELSFTSRAADGTDISRTLVFQRSR
ncbi:MAG: lipocalin-like domain-containing protein [Acidobacteria bacterium]|nr:lipocalin-like domain-containing protein [Acidobacteriota bacterium]